MQNRNARIGMILFVIYLLMYGGFVYLTAFQTEKMELTPIPGVNLAILYGFGLILAALVLALVYGFLCKSSKGEKEAQAKEGEE